MALKFRRGTTAQQSGSLAFGEPFVNTTLGTLVIGGATGDIVLSAGGTGSTGNFGAISGSGLDITGNANIAGNLTLGGKLTIGDATSDTVNVVASLSSSLIPQTTNAFDLGSATKAWRDLYVSTGSIKFVANNTVISTLSANADGSQNFSNGVRITGSLIASGSNIEFTRGWPAVGNESHFLRLAPFTASNGRPYEGIGITIEHWNDGTGTYEHSLQIHSFDNDSNPTYGAELNVSPFRTHIQAIPSGSGVTNVANISVQDLKNEKSQALIYGDYVQIGVYHGDFVTIGNSGSVVEISGSVRANITGSIAATNGVVSGSSQVTLQSTTGFSAFNTALSTITGSLISSASTAKTTNDSQDISITNLNSTTASLNTFSSSVLSQLTTLGTYTASVEGRFTSLATISGSLILTASANTVSIVNLNTFSGSQLTQNTALATITGSLILSASADRVSITNLNTLTASALTRFTNLETTSASVNTSVSNLNTLTASALTRLTALEVETSNLETFSGSQLDKDATLATYTGSNDTKWSTLGSLSGSFARTNSANTFNGTQTVSGSLYVTQDLVVAGSSSIQNISSSNLVIGAAYVTLNTATPSSRFAGLQIIDSGSSGGSGSFLYDAVQDEFIFIHRGNGIDTTSSVFLLGPETYNNLGNEIYITENRILKGTRNEHTANSNITDDGTTISLGSNVTITGSVTISGNVDGVDISVFNSNVNSTTASLLIETANLESFSSSALTRLTTLEVETVNLESFSSSALTRLTTLEVETVNLESFTSSINTTIKTRLNAETVVSGSSQITAGSTTGFSTAVKTQLDANTVVSGSSQINVASTTGDIALGSRTSGNYVASLVAGTNITLSNNTGEGATPTIGLTNNTISGVSLGGNLATLTIGTGLSGTSYNGSSLVTIANTGVTSITSNTGLSSNVGATGAVTITNTGVTSNVAGTGISVSGATGAVTITNTGVTSAVAGTGVSVSGATGAVTISIGQSVATSANAQFNSLGIGMAASATVGRIDATNDIVAFSSSDIRFKENIKPIENAIDKIRKISGNTYDWKEENKVEHGYEGNDVGVIAQEIEAVLPQLVQTRENGFKAVKYDKLVALLIQGIKEQQLQIEELKAKMGL